MYKRFVIIANPLLPVLFSISCVSFVLAENLPRRRFAGTMFVYFPAGTCECEVLKTNGTFVDDTKKTIPILPFWLATTEVTVGEFKIFCNATSYMTEPESRRARGSGYVPRNTPPISDSLTWKNPGFEQTDDCPVTCVTYRDIQEYCAWLTKQNIDTFRLPTTAEWQYAYLYDMDSKLEVEELVGYVNLADQALGDYEKLADKELVRPEKKSYRETSWNDGFVFTAPVRAKKALRNGLHFMNGNVSEICDLLPELIDNANAVPAGLKLFAISGACWLANFERQPTHLSTLMAPGSGSNTWGFRLVCDFKEE